MTVLFAGFERYAIFLSCRHTNRYIVAEFRIWLKIQKAISLQGWILNQPLKFVMKIGKLHITVGQNFICPKFLVRVMHFWASISHAFFDKILYFCSQKISTNHPFFGTPCRNWTKCEYHYSVLSIWIIE